MTSDTKPERQKINQRLVSAPTYPVSTIAKRLTDH